MDIAKRLLGSLLGHLFTVGGITTIVLSGDQIQAIVGALSTVAGIVWEVWRSTKQSAVPLLEATHAVQARAPQDPANL